MINKYKIIFLIKPSGPFYHTLGYILLIKPSGPF